MRAFVYYGKDKLVFDDHPEPKCGSDGVIIKVKTCSVCGTDLRAFNHGSSRITPPRVIGHEVSGTIMEKGKNVRNFEIGDRVTLAPAIGCGKCYSCRRGYTNLCDNLQTIGFQFDGGFAEYMEIPGIAFAMNNVIKLTGEINYEEACLAEPIACGLNGQEFLHIQDGHYVAVFGAGFLGCIHSEIAKISGAEKIFLIEPNASRMKEAVSILPYVIPINNSRGSIAEEIMDRTAGRGVDAAITACPVGKAQSDALEITSKHGRVSLFGGLPGDATGFIDSNVIHYKEISVFGAHASTAEQNRSAHKLIADKKLDAMKYVSNVYPLDNIEQAFQDLNRQIGFKAMIQNN